MRSSHSDRLRRLNRSSLAKLFGIDLACLRGIVQSAPSTTSRQASGIPAGTAVGSPRSNSYPDRSIAASAGASERTSSATPERHPVAPSTKMPQSPWPKEADEKFEDFIKNETPPVIDSARQRYYGVGYERIFGEDAGEDGHVGTDRPIFSPRRTIEEELRAEKLTDDFEAAFPGRFEEYAYA